MRIEALQAITIRLPGGELRDLRPGEPVTLPSKLAVKLLSKAQGKVRLVGHPDWLSLWRLVAEVSNGLTREDPRLGPVLRVIEGLDRAFAADDFSAFEQGMTDLREAMKGERTHDACDAANPNGRYTEAGPERVTHWQDNDREADA